jgi:hypothetical protein
MTVMWIILIVALLGVLIVGVAFPLSFPKD